MTSVMEGISRLLPGTRCLIPNDDGTRDAYERVVWEDVPDTVPTWAAVQAAMMEADKPRLKQHVNAVRDEREAGPFTINGYSVDTDPKSQSKLTGKALAVQAGLVSGDVQWRMADDVTYAISQSDFMQVARGVSEKVEAVYTFSWQLKANINVGAITTMDEIDNADWPM